MRFISLTLVATAFLAVGSQAAFAAERADKVAPRAAEVYKRSEFATGTGEGKPAEKLLPKKRQAAYNQVPADNQSAVKLSGKRDPKLKRDPEIERVDAIQPEGNKPVQNGLNEKRQSKVNEQSEEIESANKLPEKRQLVINSTEEPEKNEAIENSPVKRGPP
ncbi:hypothetical protein BCR43DRAFT_566933 [Syncephalastrum racemosum]|uniref:Uncharacterized protein n=1 Tax=Syncephalastrum racemosum TaxID=13706 RepID=A0A1X2GZV3_SYNRA|nr:hypothetical protein BCR43DRAFT_566933 [Syncephalastrum racemosum]